MKFTERATEKLRDLLAAITCNDCESAADAATTLSSMLRGEELPIVELLGPGEVRNPDPGHIRVAV